MNGTIEIRADTRFYLDTNIFVEAFEGRGTLSALLARLLTVVENEERPRLVTSELTVAELLVKPIALQRHDLIQVYDNWTISNAYLEVVPVVRDILRDAAALRAQGKTLKLPDAIHLTTARGTGCRFFLTRDRRIKGQYGVEILEATDNAVEDILEVLCR
jgi:predicted nucleic acid-binding protein